VFNIGRAIVFRFHDDKEYKKFIDVFKNSGVRFQNDFIIQKIFLENKTQDDKFDKRVLRMTEKQFKEDMKHHYWLKNLEERIYNYGKTHIFNTSLLYANPVIKWIIKEQLSIVKKYPIAIQKNLKKDILMAKEFKNDKFVIDYIKKRSVIEKTGRYTDLCIIDTIKNDVSEIVYIEGKKNVTNTNK